MPQKGTLWPFAIQYQHMVCNFSFEISLDPHLFWCRRFKLLSSITTECPKMFQNLVVLHFIFLYPFPWSEENIWFYSKPLTIATYTLYIWVWAHSSSISKLTKELNTVYQQNKELYIYFSYVILLPICSYKPIMMPSKVGLCRI